ncbi:hypothetical protein [Methylorubrum extorquens]|uniref:DNA (cytosine-5-)-methyltransferase n=1 Tax=Methylorubrum extorquens TaxID=408 RepID=A0AAX3WR48_METEX|nr:hypothetical protein [Methylorubrum extorquens]WHQ72569.1 hypothetical protein KEC54_13945 [Methylorubrum extorquens]
MARPSLRALRPGCRHWRKADASGRAYGNAINAEAAAAFIGAVIDTLFPTPTAAGLADGGGR